MPEARTHHRTCNLCEAMCGLIIRTEGPSVTDIRGDEEDPLSRGHICPKAVALKDLHEDPDRLRAPLVKDGAGWKTVGWEEAFELTARRIREVQAHHGRDAVAVYQGNPTVHNHGSMLFGQLFVRALRTKNKYSATSLDQLPHMLAALLMYGHQLLMPVPDVDRTDYFLVLGANPLASNGSLMSAPGIERRLKALQARGGKLVVIDPRRSETAEMADRHLFIRPGSDALFLAAVLHVILEEGRARLDRLYPFVDGFDALPRLFAAFTPEAVAAATGITAEATRTIARELSQAKSAVAYGRVGSSTQAFGGLTAWILNLLNVVTGNLDRPGGFMFTKPAIDTIGLATNIGLQGHYARRRSRVRGLPEFGGELPTACLAEEIDTPGEGQVRALITSAGNPVLSAPNGRRLDRALASLDFMVSIDIYLNETTRHAQVILPPSSPLEHGHYDLAFHMLAVRNTAKYSEPIFARPPEARHDWEIFLELSRRLPPKHGLDHYTGPLTARALSALGDERVLDLLLRSGPYGTGLVPLKRGGLSMSKLRAHPHGIDLGPLEPALPARLCTPNQHIELTPEPLVADLERLRARLSEAPLQNGALSLIGRRQLRSNNSWMHNSQRLVKGKDRCTLLMHPRDAAARALIDGTVVEIRSRVGTARVPLEVSEEVMAGVVSLPHGWGHHREGVRLSVAAQHPGASINDLTDEQLVDPLSGTAALSDVPVTVHAVDTRLTTGEERAQH